MVRLKRVLQIYCCSFNINTLFLFKIQYFMTKLEHVLKVKLFDNIFQILYYVVKVLQCFTVVKLERMLQV